jgi:lipopolysaccharide transport system ATP-binding protein
MTHAPTTLSDATPAIIIDDVSKVYKIYSKPIDRLKQSFMGGRKHYFTEYNALNPLSLVINKGQTVGIIGENGSGKSTLLQLITNTLSPTTGSITVDGRISALLELGAGFNPEFSGHDNIYLNGSILGLSTAEIDALYDGIIAFSGLEMRMIHQPVSTYSSGMYVRLAFAVAIAVEPDILIVDEALAVGDEGFQRKCFARIKALQEGGATILFVSHSARTIIDLCDHAILLDKGDMLMQGTPAQVVAQYHKILFADAKDKAAVREAILHHMPVHETPAIAEAPAPESRQVYMSSGATISQVSLQDEAGQGAHMLHYGAEYSLCFRVATQQAFSELLYAMTIKTMTGIEVAAAVFHGEDSRAVNANEMIDVRFSFPCTLYKGDYFVNVGVIQRVHGVTKFIHRITDACHLKVLPMEGLEREGRIEPLGIVDIGISCTVNHREERA